MAKGIKKIRWVPKEGGADVFSKLSAPNVSLAIEPDKFAWFTPNEWFPATTETEKKQDIIWIMQDRSTAKPVVIKKKQLSASQMYGINIPKKLCGIFSYYIEASLTGKFDVVNPTGLFVRGYCVPKIVKSKWSVSSDGTAAAKSKQFSYGEQLYLNLETEGLNGIQNLTIQVYRKKIGFDQLMYTFTKVQVNDGEVNVELNQTANWYGLAGFPTEVEEYYVQVKMGNGNYVLDDHQDTEHARYLRIKPNQVPQKIEAPKNTSILKVAEPNVNKQNYHPCRFKQINIDDNGLTTVFDKGVTILQKQRNTTRNIKQVVHFDYDKDALRTDAKQILDRLLDFLLFNSHLDIKLEGHADDRGELNYNQALSERRAMAVKNYFFDKGLQKTRILTQGFGEARNAVSNAYKEEHHAKNRRTQIDFSYIDYDSDAILYQTIAGTELKPKKLDIKVVDHEASKCFRQKDKHTKEIVVTHKSKTTKVQASEIKHSVYNDVPPHFVSNYLYYLLQYLTPGISLANKYELNVHTCAYFADKNSPTLDIRVYPDLVWIAHLQYNFAKKGDYWFQDKALSLKTGIKEVLDEYRNSLLGKIIGYLPANYFFQDMIFDYIEKEARAYSYAADIIYERSIEKAGEKLALTGTRLNLLTETKYTKYAAAATIYGLVICVIIIDILIIYLTRGKNLEGRAKKIQKVLRKIKALEKVLERKGDLEIELIPPSIAVNAGMYYYQQADKRVAMVYEANIKADPFLAIEIKKEFDLSEMLDKGLDIKNKKATTSKETKSLLEKLKPNTAKVKSFLANNGIKVKGEITVTGEISFEHNVKYNVLTKEFTVKQILGQALATQKDERLFKAQISFSAKLTGTIDKEYKVLGLQTKVDGQLDLSANGAVALRIKYGINPKQGMYLQPVLVFSGLKGVYSGNFKIKTNLQEYKLVDIEHKITPTPFTLIEPFELDLFKTQLFNQSKEPTGGVGGW